MPEHVDIRTGITLFRAKCIGMKVRRRYGYMSFEEYGCLIARMLRSGSEDSIKIAGILRKQIKSTVSCIFFIHGSASKFTPCRPKTYIPYARPK